MDNGIGFAKYLECGKEVYNKTKKNLFERAERMCYFSSHYKIELPK